MTRTLLYSVDGRALVTDKTAADFDREHEMLTIALGLLCQQVRNPELVARQLVNAIINVVGKEKILTRYPALELVTAPQAEAEGVH